MRDIKMIVTDFDDTFYVHNPAGSWKVDNPAALNEARDAGIFVYPCTARPWPQAAKLIADFNFNNLCVHDNGAAIVRIDSDETIFQKSMSRDIVEAVLDFAQRYDLVTQICAARFMGYFTPNGKTKEEQIKKTMESINLDKFAFFLSNSIEEALETYQDNCLLIRFIIEPEDGSISKAMEDELLSLRDIEVTWSHLRAMDIMAKGVNKGDGLEKLAKLTGVSLKNIMALGDAKNDASMLKIAGFGVAMGDAAQITKDAADYVSENAVDSGFAKAVRKFALGK